MNEQKAPKGIEWTRYKGRRGYTWNPVVGCSHQCEWDMPEGRIICYAKRQAESGALAKFYPNGFAAHYFHPQRLDEPRSLSEPSGIFVSSMGDLFGGQVDKGQIMQVVRAMRETPQHVYFVLTKNPARMRAYVSQTSGTDDEMPRNVLLGISMPPDYFSGKYLDDYQKAIWLSGALESLWWLRQRGYVTWMSFEPLSWDVSALVGELPGALQWAVIGAASAADPANPRKQVYFPPVPEHLERLHRVLDQRNVPVFHKGNLREFAVEVREEFPELL